MLAGCAQEMPREAGAPRILAMGDSLLSWNRLRGQSVAHAVEHRTGQEVVDRSVIGARILLSTSVTGLLKGPIAAQYVPGNWDWIILSGGGNDLWWGCGCTRCEARLETLIAPDGSAGAIPDLVTALRATGARVIWLGYLRVPGRPSPVDHCHAIIGAFEDRLARMAAHDRDVTFMSNRDLVPAGDLRFMAIDRIHPSARGSAAIADRVAAIIDDEDN